MDDEPLLTLVGATSFALGLPFFFGALAKLRDPGRFVSIVREYRLVPDQLASFVAGGVVAAELAVAALLASGLAIAISSTCATLLSLGFVGAVLINLRRRRAIICGCFGDDERISGRTVLRLLTMTGAGIFTSGAALAVHEVSALSDPSQFLRRAAIGVPIALLGRWIIAVPELAELAHVRLNRRQGLSDTREPRAAS